MRVLITGGRGQLGRDLQGSLNAHDVDAPSHGDLDVTDERACADRIASFRPEVVVHCAALTDTTRCEREPDAAHAVNAAGARNVAAACREADASMVYIGTNEVFDGRKREPYVETDAPRPLNAYGASKLEGEQLVRQTLPQHYIIRTAWLYGQGGTNFVTKVLAAAGAGRVSGVIDETATPTWTRDLAAALGALIETGRYGVYHLTNGGQASRYDWAKEALRLAGNKADVRPVTTEEYRASLPPDAVAPRKPPYSVLANKAAAALGIELRPWQDALGEYFAMLP